jgi:Ser/Thr protein kinase RdoA (MazF antagonist)
MPINDHHTETTRVLNEYGLATSELVPIVGGLINLTWRVSAPSGLHFVLQRLHAIFPPEVNLNLERVTRHLAARGRLTPRLVATLSDRWWVEDAGATWRLMTYIDGASFATLTNQRHASAAGQLLGEFHQAGQDFTETLPFVRLPVHDPQRHFANLRDTLRAASGHRHQDAVESIATSIASAFKALPPVVVTPLRLVHGDPKLSNLLFDSTWTPRCMVDLDTVGFAPLVYELGDAFRSWCNPEPEDSAHASFQLSLFEAAVAGYAKAMHGTVSDPEIHGIVTATEMIYLELAARFANDAINENYFGWDPTRYPSRGDHNLARARNQLLAARSLAGQRAAAEVAVRRAFAP